MASTTLLQLVQEGISLAVPPIAYGGILTHGRTHCIFCGAMGSLDHEVVHKDDYWAKKAQVFLGQLEGKICMHCDRPAVWVRSTQFSGDHKFCDEHARLEDDFGKSDPSYFVWEKVE